MGRPLPGRGRSRDGRSQLTSAPHPDRDTRAGGAADRGGCGGWGRARSTVGSACPPRQCTRCWSAAGSTARPANRYEHPHPGSLIHVDVTKPPWTSQPSHERHSEKFPTIGQARPLRQLSRCDRYLAAVPSPRRELIALRYSSAKSPNGVSASRGSIHMLRRISDSWSLPRFVAAASEVKADWLPHVPPGRSYRARHPSPLFRRAPSSPTLVWVSIHAARERRACGTCLVIRRISPIWSRPNRYCFPIRR